MSIATAKSEQHKPDTHLGLSTTDIHSDGFEIQGIFELHVLFGVLLLLVLLPFCFDIGLALKSGLNLAIHFCKHCIQWMLGI